MLVNILIAFALFIALLLVLALFIKKSYTIQAEVVIHQPKQKVFDYVRLVKNQDNYNKWTMTDPLMKKDFRGTDGTPGFVYSWNGNDKAGQGEQELKSIREGERIDTEIRFERPFKDTATTTMITETISANDTKVTWTMQGNFNYPLNLMRVFVTGMLNKDLRTSIDSLKKVLEEK